MKEKTTLADAYLLKHFYGTCTGHHKESIGCDGVKLLREEYSWNDVILDGEMTCRDCMFATDRKGIYYGKQTFSDGFENQEYVAVKIRSQEEFEAVCGRISPNVRGITIRGAFHDGSPLEKFKNLEFIVLSGQRIHCFWDISKNPELRIITVYGNDHLSSLAGLEKAKKLECIQFLTDTSRLSAVKIDSLAPLSGLKDLREVILSGTEPLDHNIDHLISLPNLQYLWVSPNVFPMECYARFEAKKFMLSEEFGIYCDDGANIFPYGKGKRILRSAEQKNNYLHQYMELYKQFK